MGKDRDLHLMLRTTNVLGMEIGDNKLLHLAASKREHQHSSNKDGLMCLTVVMKTYATTVAYLDILLGIAQLG